MKPKIGITIDSFDPAVDEDSKYYSKYYWYAMKQQCIVAVTQRGGIPILLPHHLELIDDYTKMLDGLLISGGGFDVPPNYYGAELNPKTRLKIRRSEFESTIAEHFIFEKKPILGICGGMQLLVALYKGTLIQALDEESSFQNHNQPNPPFESFHEIQCVEGTRLHSFLQTRKFSVNSVHRQGAKTPGKLIVNAYSEDGLIEGVEDPNHPFCIGVQWHPEFFVTNFDTMIFDEFIKHAAK